ncbi:helix-turn-helix transcriptional regulator [Macrococcus capreoli]
MIDRDLPLKKEISRNIEKLLKENRWTQKELAEKTGISKSTISDYLNFKTLINPGNVEKIAKVFNVSKGAIDPTFGNKNNTSYLNESPAKYNPHVETIAAHIDDDVTDEQMEDIIKYIEFIKTQKFN